MTRLRVVAEYLQHRFADPDLLVQACTHASHDAQTSRHQAHPNERLEFLGDALLGAAVAEWLYQEFPQAQEGSMTRLRSQLVSRNNLATAMDASPLLAHCLVGAHNEGQWPTSVKANLAEAILGAIYLDGGWDALVCGVRHLLAHSLAHCTEQPAADWKNRLQEWCLATYQELPTYTSKRQGGSDHDPVFAAQVQIKEHNAEATGPSRRQSERNAAEALFTKLHPTDGPD